MLKLSVTIKGGRITNRTDIQRVFHMLPDGNYQLNLTPVTIRTMDQNAYYWKIVVPIIKTGLIEIGYENVKTDEDAHQVMKGLFLKDQHEPTTTKLTTKEYSIYLESIYQWAAEYLSVNIPSPVRLHPKIRNHGQSDQS